MRPSIIKLVFDLEGKRGWLSFLLCCLTFTQSKAFVTPTIQQSETKLCHSTREFIIAYEFLRTHGTAGMKDQVAQDVADQVARGCDGAAGRFQDTFLLLSKMGVSHLKTLEMSLEFSHMSDEIQRNFFEILKHSYLSEFFDYDFEVALKIAYEFSKDLKGNHVRAKEDFISLVNFCLDKKNMALPVNACGLLSLELVRLSPYYPDGVFNPFIELYEKLRSGDSYGLSVKESLEVSLHVLKFGPRSPDNFNQAYAYAVSEQGLRAKPKEALAFALRMAGRSATGQPLPIAKSELEISEEEDAKKNQVVRQ